MEKSDFFYAPNATDCREDMAPPVVPGPDGCHPAYKPGLTKLI